jgi:glycosyltransferase involved in cell wall biosynthesis
MTDCLPGSGIDLQWFSSDLLLNNQPNIQLVPKKNMQFLLIARMLWDKGVGEYVEAARILKGCYPNIDFCLLGFLDVANPASITKTQMDEWVAEGVINYLGESDDIRPYVLASECIVLPSYREGLPRTLLEAAAMSRPIVATDTVGCRDVVEEGVNGLLCRPKDAHDLADKIEKMILMSAEDRFEMGRQGRIKVENLFDEQIVIKKYLNTIASIFARTS